MKLEEVLPYLRQGGEIHFKGQALGGHWATDALLTVGDLLSDEWSAQLTDEQIIKIWENDIELRKSTGQTAQAALLRDCVKLLRTRKL